MISNMQANIQSQSALKIHSAKLDDTLWIVSDETCLDQVTDDDPVYLVREIELIENVNLKTLQIIHAIKKKFDGEIVSEEKMERWRIREKFRMAREGKESEILKQSVSMLNPVRNREEDGSAVANTQQVSLPL